MIKIFMIVFFVLHGLVHLLYFGQSRRLFELQPGMTWPEGSWAFSKLLGADRTRSLANMACVAAAIGFVAGGVGLLVEQAWWRPVAVGAAVFSSAVYILFWNGKMQRLDNQGALGLLINVALLVMVLFLRWPDGEI